MEIRIEIELGINDSTKAFIKEIMMGAVLRKQAAEPVLVNEPIKSAPEKKAEKKPVKKAAEPAPAEDPELKKAEEVIPVKEEPKPEPAPEKTEAPVNYDEKRKQLRAYCSKRKAEGVNIPALIFEFLGKKGAKFSEIPDERLADFEELVKAAKAE